MLVSIKVVATCLLCFLFQDCSCGLNSCNIVSFEQTREDIGTFSDIASYASTLDSSLKDRIFNILKDGSLYDRFLKRIGVSPNMQLEQLSPDQQETWSKVHLLFIDLYRIVYKSIEPIVMKYNNSRKLEEAPIDLNRCSLEFMSIVLLEAVDVSKYSSRRALEYTAADKKVFDVIKSCYIIPCNRYIDGCDWRTLKEEVDKGRIEAYQAFMNLRKEIEESESEKL